ncbi:MAG: hypothetical protein RMJ98_06510 [Myxococcales bacterium]|nr:hypothetical protein [Polyangiaceae bacterium]MDW8248937.1 hypothetical protein [Myxococcales bacterium]
MAPALRYLDSASMLSLSSGWLGPRRVLLEQSAELTALLPRLEEAHQALLLAQKTTPNMSREESAHLASQAQSLDDQHDHAVRALYFAVSAALSFRLASEAPDAEEVARLEALRDMILPDGLAITQAPYEVEAATAARAREAVASDPEAQKLLREIKLFPRVTGLDLLSRWADLGAKLGSVEFQRAVGPINPGEVNPVRARNAWLSVVASMLSVLPVVRSEEARRAVLDPLNEACTKAAKRQVKAAKGDAQRGP